MIKLKQLLFAFALIIIITSCRQEKILFYPEILPQDYAFHFQNKFSEYYFKVDEKTELNGLLFPADSSRGLIFYLHGNAGCLDSWANCSEVYTRNNYDFFMLDYRGYGKSQGKISSEKQLLNDIQLVYDSLKTLYSENKIVIIGYSIGTGPAAYLASTNNPRLLILQAPYFNIPDLAQEYFKIIPAFMVRYKLKTNEFIPKVKCPVIIFHGDEDEVIYTGSSYKLKELFKKEDRLIILKGQKHNGMNENEEYQRELKAVLN